MSSVARFAEADAALSAGRRAEGIDLILEQLTAEPVAPANVYRSVCGLLIRDTRYAPAEQWCRVGVEQYPRDLDLLNMLGVSLRRLHRYDEALEVFARCLKLDPKNITPQINAGNVHNDRRDGPSGLAVWTKLVRLQPANAEFQRALGRSYWNLADLDKAEMRFRLATKLKSDYLDAWLDLANVTAERDPAAALEVFDRGLAAMPNEARLAESKTLMLRRAGRTAEAEAYLAGLLSEQGDVAWVHQHLGQCVMERDRLRAHIHMQKAIELAPDRTDYQVSLAESLGRTRINESAMLEQAYQVLCGVADRMEKTAGHVKVASELFTRVGDYDAAEALSNFKDQGRLYAEAGKHTALLAHLARVKTPEDRVELMAQHKLWGDNLIAYADKRPIVHRGRRKPDGKIRIGFMSSDLRAHPVAYFALPLFQHYDRSRFEIYCYSFYLGDEDKLQERITTLVDKFRWEKEIPDRDAAQMIADDQLDILIELGASTHMNKLNVMAFRPAPLQASWLGYPHSAGLTTIDHFILDPYVVPPQRELVLEEPLLMPKSWIAMGELAFPERPITPEIPQARNGYLTIGTANNPYKYSKAMVRTWARVTAAIPDARFMFVRPEGGAPSFRRNMTEIFAAEGVSADRIRFEDVRGAHMPFYNDLDMSLDTFPQTGGTTTCEALFMGVPVVTRVGEAVFERLSYSILSNAGLGDLCAFSEEEFMQIALKLAADRPRREMLRTQLRGMLKQSPLGQTTQFAADFYKMIEGAVTAAHQVQPAAETV